MCYGQLTDVKTINKDVETKRSATLPTPLVMTTRVPAPPRPLRLLPLPEMSPAEPVSIQYGRARSAVRVPWTETHLQR